MSNPFTMDRRVLSVGGELTWRCARCAEGIGVGAGAFVLSYREQEEAAKALRAWHAERHEEDVKRDALPISEQIESLFYSRSDLNKLECPRRASWIPTHYRCAEDLGGYEVAVERLRTADAVLDWTAHFGEKGWLASTSWVETVVQSAKDALGGDRA